MMPLGFLLETLLDLTEIGLFKSSTGANAKSPPFAIQTHGPCSWYPATRYLKSSKIRTPVKVLQANQDTK
jgi:hypothetical protein